MAGLMGQKPQHMMGLGVGRIGLKDLPIERFRLRKVAGLMELHGTMEQLGDGGHGYIVGWVKRTRADPPNRAWSWWVSASTLDPPY